MACESGCNSSHSSYKKELDETTDVLCSLCQRIEDLEEFDLFTEKARKWWAAHKALDRKRKEREKDAIESQLKRLEDLQKKTDKDIIEAKEKLNEALRGLK